MSFKLSVEAEEDIIAIAEQGARMFGVDQAKRYHDELFTLFDLIAANPRIARERNEIEPPVRIHPFKAHLIVYRVEDVALADPATYQGRGIGDSFLPFAAYCATGRSAVQPSKVRIRFLNSQHVALFPYQNTTG